MMAAVLIIYYKQISEGYDDHDRFTIMQKVGMSRKEVHRTIMKRFAWCFSCRWPPPRCTSSWRSR